MNKVIMCGRLTKEPDIRSGGDKTIGRFNIAVDRKFKTDGQPDTDFFNCISFGKQAEFVGKYLNKGTKVIIVGEVRNDNYTDKNGVQHYSTQIYVNEIEFAESKKAESQPSADKGFMSIPDGLEEELPFK